MNPFYHLYHQHLELQTRQQLFPNTLHTPPREQPPPKSLLTNFGISLLNHFAFLLLHLKKQTSSKNYLSVTVPDTCIFHKGIPYQLLYSEGGDVKSRPKEGLRLGEIYTFFRSRSQKKGHNKQEPFLACFQDDYLMLSETDLFITCRKFRNDPFFSKLQYLRNKVGQEGDPIAINFEAQKEYELAAAALEGLRGVSQPAFLQQMGEQLYLKYLCVKISLFLTFQSNIRLSQGCFCFARTGQSYTLVDAFHLKFHNLTFALRERQFRLQLRQQERDKILIMDEEKQKRYKSYEGRQRVKQIQGVMDNQWEDLAAKTRVPTDLNRKKEEQKNALALKILFSKRNEHLEEKGSMSMYDRSMRGSVKVVRRKGLAKNRRYLVNYQLSGQKRNLTEPNQSTKITHFTP